MATSSMALDRLGDPADGDCLLVEAQSEDGRLLTPLSFVPGAPPRRPGLTGAAPEGGIV
ncbi:hypothetical protein ACWDDN_17660 [Streptomyces griseoruber]|uniref:hypothetical protein n=2 Tax=Streptomyces griseoruber TaxID=1943 RepID=UPI0037B0E1E2